MDLTWLLGHHRTAFHHAHETVSLPLRSDDRSDADSGKQASIRLADFCRDVTPACRLNPFLFNGDLHTCYTAVKSQAVPVHYRRRIFESDDPHYPGTFAVDFTTHTAAKEEDKTLHARTTYYSEEEWRGIASDDCRPMLVTLHGLAGGSQELYLRHVLSPLINGEVEGTGERWEACVVIARGCANSKLTTPINFNARATWDLKQTVKWLRITFPNRPLFGLGFSLGANILVNYLAEEGDMCPLKAAVACANPWNLDISCVHLQSTWIGREVYSKVMGGGMRVLFERHIDQMSKNPGVDVEKVRKTRYLFEFDREVQAPVWGYPTEGAYYRDASSTEPLMAVKIPLFAINAEDDPIVSIDACPMQEVKQNPYAVLCTTSVGGHLGWFELGGGRWFVKPIVNFLRKMSSEIDLDILTAQACPDQHNALIPNKSGRVFEPTRRRLHFAS